MTEIAGWVSPKYALVQLPELIISRRLIKPLSLTISE